MKAKLATILLGVLALTGSEAAGQTSADKACRGLVITADDQAPGRGGPVFSARGVLDVKLRMLFPASFKPDREELLRVALTTPNGFPYQELEVPLVAAGAKEKQRELAGYPFPVKTKPLAAAKDEKGSPVQAVEVKVPVAGTAITESGLYGTWKVDVWVGEARPCSGSFKLTP